MAAIRQIKSSFRPMPSSTCGDTTKWDRNGKPPSFRLVAAAGSGSQIKPLTTIITPSREGVRAEGVGGIKRARTLSPLVLITGTNRAFSAPFPLLIPAGAGAMGGHWAVAHSSRRCLPEIEKLTINNCPQFTF